MGCAGRSVRSERKLDGLKCSVGFGGIRILGYAASTGTTDSMNPCSSRTTLRSTTKMQGVRVTSRILTRCYMLKTGDFQKKFVCKC